MSKKTQNEEIDKRIKAIKDQIYEYQDMVFFALLIEAATESSFQCYFQTLYRFYGGGLLCYFYGNLFFCKV